MGYIRLSQAEDYWQDEATLASDPLYAVSGFRFSHKTLHDDSRDLGG